MLDLSPPEAASVLLKFCIPICAWVIYTDLKYMKIRNLAVMALIAVFAVVGLFVLPLEVWAWRWVNLPVVLGIGLLLNMAAGVGMGDVKFAAAAAPFFSTNPNHIWLMILLLQACLIAAFITHRGARAIPAVRAATPDWVSWGHHKFPFGLVLVGTLIGYLGMLSRAT
ncbi:prepilin peptidase CpaA [Rhodobacter aestuarii]|uniref:Prepilin peptidase CpaA n=2 Tax=Rhodobacter aestuarii TaxID=453582 RepID=A0A1N7N5W7_9RHOB|nr:prepilin peptidase [Rhodobacter aestuarii]PTV96255.1 prepilin peptidase CpaA [Rhodobacter aestuarii]SIS93744.1 prepilin peptidase CpaA [Rhodobacter aestuarii]